MYAQQPAYYPPPQQPNYYNQDYQMGQYQQQQQQFDPYYQQPAYIAPQQVYVQPQMPNSQPMFIPPPVIIEPVEQQPQIEVRGLERRDYCTQDMKTWVKSRLPQEIYCVKCNKIVKTKINYELGTGSWCVAILFCCLPLCLESMQDVVHHCPQCKSKCGFKKYLC